MLESVLGTKRKCRTAWAISEAVTTRMSGEVDNGAAIRANPLRGGGYQWIGRALSLNGGDAEDQRLTIQSLAVR